MDVPGAAPHVLEAAGLEAVLVDRATDDLVGGNGLLEMDYHNRFGETESFFLPPYRNQGYGSEGKHLALDFRAVAESAGVSGTPRISSWLVRRTITLGV